MGNSNSSQNIGFKYFLGVHAVLAQNKLRILSIKFGEKTAWKGSKAGGETIGIDNKELFGGADAEGGVSGSIDVLNGDAAQTKNSYLQSAIGGVISAYRGVTSLVFKQFYFGNNPYLKRMAIKAIDADIAAGWYIGKAYVNIDGTSSKAEIMIIMDGSGSMAGTKEAYEKAAVAEFIESLKGSVNDVKIVFMRGAFAFPNNDDSSVTEISDCVDADYDTLISWVNALPAARGNTFYEWGFSRLQAFFSTDTTITEISGTGILESEGDKGAAIADTMRRVCLFMTDGAPTNGQTSVNNALTYLVGYEHVEVFAFNIDDADIQYTVQLDNTTADSVPVLLSSDENSLAGAFTPATTSWADMNAAHILRDALVYANGDDASIIGDTFETVADTLYAEGMGLSMLWRNTLTHEQFMDDVKAHADCVTYADRTTGKMEIKAIRNDYTVGSLFTFNKTNVVKWHDDIGRPRQNELPNQITVVYTKRSDGSEASITVANIAAIQQVGRVISEKIEYRGITTDALAGKVVMRDLSARTVPLLSGTIDVTYAPIALNIGSPFILDNSDFGIDSVVVRVTDKEEAGGKTSRTSLTFIEDKFDMPATAAVVPDTLTVSSKAALNATYRLFEEVSYYTLVLDQSKSAIDAVLTDDPTSGIVALAGSKPNSFHSSVDTATNSGAGWVLISSGGFMPASTIVADISEADTVSFDIVDNDTLRQVVAGSLCLIDSEIIRVDNMVISGDNVTMTVGRGCLDTTPAPHSTGTEILFYDGYTQADKTVYVAGETIDGKILPKTSEGRLSLDDATTEQVTLNSRAIRPYPVGNLKMDGSLSPSGILDAVIPITWVHRDRTLQLTTSVEDYEDASIGPETGVEYTVEVRAILGRADFFADADFFDHTSFFTQEGEGVLIRKEVVAQHDSYEYDENGVSDFFAAAEPDFFAATDFFDTDELPDFFMVVGGLAYETQITVSVERDGYENWQTSSVSGKHLMSAINLELDAY